MKRFTYLHALLFGAYPVLFLYAHNAHEMPWQDVVVPLIAVIAFAVVVTFLLGLLLRNFHKSALIATIFLLLFFSFGHVASMLPGFEWITGLGTISTADVLLAVWVLLFLIGILVIFRTRRSLQITSQVLFVVGAVMVAIQVVMGGSVLIQRKSQHSLSETASVADGHAGRAPDIYYLVVDGYARADILEGMYGVDNSRFLTFLHDHGFQVADRSCSNYCQTLLSLTATLNLNYIDEIGTYNVDSKDRVPLADQLRNSYVIRYLKEHGYDIVCFASGFNFTEFKDVDRFIKVSHTVSDFQNTLITTTPVAFLLRDEYSQYDMHRRRVNFILDKLPRVYSAGAPLFVFAHILSPHPPFVFDSEGQPVDPDHKYHMGDGSHYLNLASHVSYLVGYAQQITYLTERLQETIAEILERSPDMPPIIILQADHGPGSGLDWRRKENTNLRERFSILNACLLPGDKVECIGQAMTPVNTFRVIMNRYFGGDYPMLPDRCFWSTWERPFVFLEVTDELKRN